MRPTELRTTARRAAAALACVLVLAAGCAASGPPVTHAGFVAPGPGAPARTVPCNLWNAIGDTPATEEIDAAAGRFDVVVLNPWETGALARLRAADPDVTVLVYQDFSSTRSYAGAVVGGRDAEFLPTGVGYADADRNHPEWFATDRAGDRVGWGPYPGHWQMAVWDPGYRQRWTGNVLDVAVDGGWDGVFADNDFARLRYYSPAVLAGTADAAGTDRLVRDGLDALVEEAGTALNAAGKLLVPNVSEARQFPGRWDLHTRFGGGMEEHFAYFDDASGGGAFLTDSDPTGWLVQSAQVGLPDRLNLVITRTAPDDRRAQRYGFATAAVRGEGRVCWTVNTVGTYTAPETTPEQDLEIGSPLGPAVRSDGGVWSREFTRGWVAVNPTTSPATVRAPDGDTFEVPATDAVVRGGS